MSTATATIEPVRPGSTADAVRCAHCDLDVPAGLVDPLVAHQFCCEGCRSAYDIIHGAGLDAYYDVRRRASARTGRAAATGRRYAELDDAAFHRLYVRPGTGGVCSTELFLEGVHCAACVWLVEKLPLLVPGTIDARLDARRAILHLAFEPARAPLSAIAGALDTLGYPPHPARDARAREARRAEDRRHLVRLGVAGACAGNVMLLALALYAGAFGAMDPLYRELFRYASLLITAVSLAWPGAVFFRGALAAIRTRTLSLDVPIAVGLAAGGIWGAVNTIRGQGEVYFDSIAVLTFALLLGRWVQHRQQRWAADALELLFSLTPTHAARIENGVARDVPIEAVAPGDLVEVRAGDSIPVDGTVESGTSSIDQSLLTGEPLPVPVGPGAHVPAGAVNTGAGIRVRVEATGESTRVGRLLRLVEDCARRRAPILRLADRVSGVFVAAVFAGAIVTAGAWATVSVDAALENAVALLIVTCPCALGLATPLAMTVAIGRGARRGILVKGADALERLARPGRIFLDKTGTVTAGRMRLEAWHGDDALRPGVAALEAHAAHPIALALRRELAAPDACPVDGVAQTTGGGIRGTVDGVELVVGSPAFVRARARADARLDAAAAAAAGAGQTPVMIAAGGRCAAVAVLADPVREDAPDAIESLRRAGWRVGLLSGDHPDTVRAVGARLGIGSADAIGGVTPEGKLDAVRSALRDGPVVMIGDGVNDAAALAAATVGVAVHAGAEASLAAADVCLNRPGLAPVVELVEGARRVIGVIHRNFAVAVAYNLAAGAMAVAGVIHPLAAAVIMPLSSLSVVALSYRARTFPEDRPCR